MSRQLLGDTACRECLTLLIALTDTGASIGVGWCPTCGTAVSRPRSAPDRWMPPQAVRDRRPREERLPGDTKQLPDGWEWNTAADAIETAIATGLGDVGDVRLVLAQSRDGYTCEVWRDSDGPLYVHAEGALVWVVRAAIAKALDAEGKP